MYNGYVAYLIHVLHFILSDYSWQITYIPDRKGRFPKLLHASVTRGGRLQFYVQSMAPIPRARIRVSNLCARESGTALPMLNSKALIFGTIQFH